jgi:drug/metabolite transporter (DMT)-like permease
LGPGRSFHTTGIGAIPLLILPIPLMATLDWPAISLTAWLWLSETLTIWQWAGALLAISGVVMARRYTHAV